MTYRSLASVIRGVLREEKKNSTPAPMVEELAEETKKKDLDVTPLNRDTLITKLRAKAERQKKIIDNA